MKTFFFLLIALAIFSACSKSGQRLPSLTSIKDDETITEIPSYGDTLPNGRIIIDMNNEWNEVIEDVVYNVIYVDKQDTFTLDGLSPYQFKEWFGYYPPYTCPRKYSPK